MHILSSPACKNTDIKVKINIICGHVCIENNFTMVCLNYFDLDIFSLCIQPKYLIILKMYALSTSHASQENVQLKEKSYIDGRFFNT